MGTSIQAFPGSLTLFLVLLSFVDSPSRVGSTIGVSQRLLIETHGLASRVAMQLASPSRIHFHTHKRLLTNSIQG